MSSSSGVGGSGRDGPLCGGMLILWSAADGPLPLLEADEAAGTTEVRCGRNSRSGFGFRSEALMVPSLRTGPSSSEESESTTRSAGSGETGTCGCCSPTKKRTGEKLSSGFFYKSQLSVFLSEGMGIRGDIFILASSKLHFIRVHNNLVLYPRNNKSICKSLATNKKFGYTTSEFTV